jgi:hypothetical protein
MQNYQNKYERCKVGGCGLTTYGLRNEQVAVERTLITALGCSDQCSFQCLHKAWSWLQYEPKHVADVVCSYQNLTCYVWQYTPTKHWNNTTVWTIQIWIYILYTVYVYSIYIYYIWVSVCIKYEAFLHSMRTGNLLHEIRELTHFIYT